MVSSFSFEQPVKDPFRLFHRPPDIETLHLFPPVRYKEVPFDFVVAHDAYLFGKFPAVAVSEEQPVDPAGDDLPDPPAVRSDAGDSRGHRLYQGKAEPFVPRRQNIE